MPREYKIVVLCGDGVSREVIPEAVKALKAAQEVVTGLELDFVKFECGFEYYKKIGEPWLKRFGFYRELFSKEFL